MGQAVVGVRPYWIPYHREASLLLERFSYFWANAEDAKDEDDKPYRLKTARFISRDKFKMDPRWNKRLALLERTVVGPGDCLYAKDGVIVRLLDMKENQPSRYDRLGDFLHNEVSGCLGVLVHWSLTNVKLLAYVLLGTDGRKWRLTGIQFLL